ncbi:MAG: pimeloyl-ACP methyl ester carboxylesterase [Myxococcota bacterium]|jgi:pimeloyl-ACP methyl ester carboxylesterase
MRLFITISFVASTALFGCSSDDSTTAAETSVASDVPETSDVSVDTAAVDVADTALPETPEWPVCTDTRPPIVMAHGLLASGDTWVHHGVRFMENGYCRSQLHAFDWDTLGGVEIALPLLDALIEQVLTDTGAEKVDLFGHSLGGSLGVAYLSDPARAAKIRRYAHIGSGIVDAPPSDAVPMLNLWSAADTIIMEKGDVPGAENLMLTTEDHYAVATSDASFETIYPFLNDGALPTGSTSIDGPTLVEGRVLALALNTPTAGSTAAIWSLKAGTAERAGEPTEFAIGDDGRFGPTTIESDLTYEFHVTGPTADDRPVHYYRQSSGKPNPFIYLRTLPDPSAGIVGGIFGGIPFADDGVVLVVFMESRSLVANVDSLTVNGVELATDDLAAPEDTTIALFIYDANANAMSDGTPVALFESFPFIAGVDMHIPADGTPIEVTLNGQTLYLNSWAAGTDGAALAVFD